MGAASSAVEALRGHRRLGPQLAEAIHLPGTPERILSIDPPLPGPLHGALRSAGIEALWSHQAEGLEVARRGDDLLVTTPTASGKSLIFHLPVLEAVAAGESGRALFLYPLKALGQDQLSKFRALAAAAALDVPAAIYDGDTPATERRRIKADPPRVLISNPDMLHLGILGRKSDWTAVLADLRWIVLDELHTYRGIFGSHFHHVLQRLLRLCRHLGAKPAFVTSSATAANAAEFAATLVGREFHHVEVSGAPREGRHLLVFQPEASPYTTTLQLLEELLRRDLKTIVFTKARRITELLYTWLRQRAPDLAGRVASYRSGFLPEERRRIEGRLFSGELDGVISTSALEMGIDVGGLDACILVGFPGSVMATWQRSGRVGRSGSESITALVALPDALDQYIVSHPAKFLARPCERLLLDPENPQVSRAHLVCAAAELPLSPELDAAYLERHAPLVGELLREDLLTREESSGELRAGVVNPHRDVNLRGAGRTSVIQERGSGRLLGTVDGVRVLHECHPGAVYLHGGRQYLVRELDLGTGRVEAEPARPDHYTTPMTEKETEILEVLAERPEGAPAAGLGRLRVTERVVGFERKRLRGGETIDRQELDLPPARFETVGLWWTVPTAVEECIRRDGRHFMGSLHASEHAAIALLPLLVVCDRGDLGGISQPLHPQLGRGGVFVYDGHPGGVGIAERAFRDLPDVLERVRQLIEACECSEGCPSCIQSPKCGNGNRPLDKAGAVELLRLLLDGDEGEAAPETFVRGATGREQEGAPAAAGTRQRSTVFVDLASGVRRGDPQGAGLAVGLVHHLEEGWMELFREEEVRDLVGRLEAADLVVTFGASRSLYPLLAGYTGVDYRRTLPTLDLAEVLEQGTGRKPGLGEAIRENLGEEAPPDRETITRWVRRGHLDRAENACRLRVELLRDLWDRGRTAGLLLGIDPTGRRRRVPVDWAG